MIKPTLYLMVGLPGSGKTTRAKLIEQDQNAVRLSPDEWVMDLYDHKLENEHNEQVREQVERLQWELCKRLLSLGQSVILENGFWSRSKRQKLREEANSIGAKVKIDYQEVPINELWRRSSSRPETKDIGMLHFTRQDLEKWAAIFEPPTQDELTDG